MVLVYHMILQNKMLKGSFDFMGRNPSRQVTTLPNLVTIGTGSRNIMVFICHVTLQDHVIKTLYSFVAWSPTK